MPPKKGAKKGSKSANKDKKPTRPTRCPPGFEWQPRDPLIEATDKNDIDRVKRLLSRGADANQALHHAIGRGKLLIAEELLKHGANIHTPVSDGDYWVPPPVIPKAEKSTKKKGKGKKKKKK
eukprot:TRINITY_DN6995_c0_g1_i2.p1 TRINITY_DN6995_c0_g1~~TRINITY_DN6995_c0_g1_i2.p1  ORF type:complete len:122 (+),score=21.28 TRINITY_DN6995_c0_g1_i2:186-551(+)